MLIISNLIINNSFCYYFYSNNKRGGGKAARGCSSPQHNEGILARKPRAAQCTTLCTVRHNTTVLVARSLRALCGGNSNTRAHARAAPPAHALAQAYALLLPGEQQQHQLAIYERLLLANFIRRLSGGLVGVGAAALPTVVQSRHSTQFTTCSLENKN